MKLVHFSMLFAAFFALTSCEKKEPLWKLVPLGDGKVDSVTQGENYDYAVFYRFSDGLKTERNIKTWSLSFESAEDGWHIRLNNGRGAGINATGNQDFSASYSVATSTQWNYDISNGKADSTAIGEWLNLSDGSSKNEVFLLNLGVDIPSTERFRKLQILSVTDSNYVIRYAKLDGSEEQQISIEKSTNSTYTYFDFVSNSTVNYAPAASDYDIEFTKYQTVLMNGTEPMWYSVDGVLLNPINTAASKLDPTTVSFDSLSITNLGEITFSNAQDIIGYDWKYYDLNGTGRYTVNPNLYIVKDQNGAVWKLSFIGFYDSSGEKGSPQFRYQRIQ